MRRSVQDTIQIESLFVDAELKEHSAFGSVYRSEAETRIYLNTSSADSDPFQMSLGVRQSVDDTAQIGVNAKVFYPDEWLDFHLVLDDDDVGGYTFSSHVKAPGLIFETKNSFETCHNNFVYYRIIGIKSFLFYSTVYLLIFCSMFSK